MCGTHTWSKILKFALRVCCRDWTALYADLLKRCHVLTLSDSHRNAKLYKIVYGLANCQMAPVSARTLTYNTRRSNPVQFQSVFAQSSQFQYSFYPHTISLWNDLSLTKDSLSSISTFKHLLMQLLGVHIVHRSASRVEQRVYDIPRHTHAHLGRGPPTFGHLA